MTAYFILTISLYYPKFTNEKTGTEKLRNFPEVKQQVEVGFPYLANKNTQDIIIVKNYSCFSEIPI
jgi:hypothetical protein